MANTAVGKEAAFFGLLAPVGFRLCVLAEPGSWYLITNRGRRDTWQTIKIHWLWHSFTGGT